MAEYFLSLVIFRMVFPLLISSCIVFRPSLLSGLYLLILFYFPFVPVPTHRTMNGHTGYFLKFLIAISTITTLGQIIFQIVLFSMPPYANFLEDCQFLEKVLRHTGFVRLNDISTISAFTWLSPEILLLLISVCVYVFLKKLIYSGTAETSSEEDGTDRSKQAKREKKRFGFLISIGRYAVLFALCFAAVLRPSVQGGLYFVVFLSASTWWACYKQLRRGFAIVLRCLIPVLLVHMGALYAYQLEWPQELLEKNSTYARYFALTPLLSVDCTQDPRDFIWSFEEWATYVNPAALYWLYYIIILESAALLKPEVLAKNTSEETTPLIRGVSPSASKYGTSKTAHPVFQDSTGSVTVTENQEEIPLDILGKGPPEEEGSSVFENVLFCLEQVLQVIIKSSYIGTNIIMMAWSITYLSWITFVLLLWANLLWLVPNQRKSMLRSSPFLVLYAWFLLLSAYIYSMNLTEEELPSKIKGINLAQIGFVKQLMLPCNPLLVKCLFTAMFWITLRQYMHERLAERQNSALAQMVAPLQVSVGTATGVKNDPENKGTKIMDKIGAHIKRFLTKFWIWVVAITLFAVAITGQRMTAFRIIYMALFLFFILTFQLSFRIWRKMMFAFWLTVIIYSMIILVMVYTYQFDNFPEYWRDYLKVPIPQQLDIGLEHFETKQLFVRLVTPTFFVIITVIQLHYFHKDFMELSDPKNTTVMSVDLEESSLQGGTAIEKSDRDEPTTTTSMKFDLTDIGNMTSLRFQQLCENGLKRLHRFMNLVYLFLELHMAKIVMFFAMLLCVYDACAVYMVVIVLIVLSLTLGRPMTIFAIFTSSVLISLLLLARMIYQIQYIEAAYLNVTCQYPNGNVTNETNVNNAHWLGFYKSDDKTTVPHLVKWNIIYILVVTLWSVVLVRQYNYRISRGRPTTRAYFMFPKVTRSDADKDLKHCVKYLFNYAFYKFGVEFSMMATVATIGFRVDMYAVIYSIWLCIIFSLNRKCLARVWDVYLIFIAVLLPIQYFMVIGLPPTLCTIYPWNGSEILRRLQEWAFLLDDEYPPNAKKLICDFILLLFVSRQAVVFRIERRYADKNYAGGSNESIIHLAEQKDFKNPTPDFITYVRSYLDILKIGVLLSFLWITLAILFLAGTNRVNIFSIGYLMGAFIFLWQGTDFYLKPIPKILKTWNLLIGYNITVILLKTLLQIVGCIFIQEIPQDSCWPVQLFGVGCVKKFGNIAREAGFTEKTECEVPREFIGLVWDGLSFGFLIMQRRIFQSYNFFHMINEAKATTILASRGADLIEELRQKRMNEQGEQERAMLEKIKTKMDRIKATQEKILSTSKRKDDEHHYVAESEYADQPTLARSSSGSSCNSVTSQPAGYHTPIDDEEEEDHAPLTPRSSLIQPQAPSSPYSAIMTTSLEGYLEPQRISFSSPPNSELNPRPPSPDDSFPVFSPPPYDEAPPYAEAISDEQTSTTRTTVQRPSSIVGPPWMAGSFVTPRQSVISYSSRSPLSHHEYKILTGRPKKMGQPPKTYKAAIRSGDYYMFDEMDDEELDLIEELDGPIDEDDPAFKESKPGLGEVFTTALKSKEPRRAIELQRRLSMPLNRQRSTHSARSQMSVPFSAPPTILEHEPKSVSYEDSKGPQPGTSKDEEMSELTEPKDEKLCQKIIGYLILAWAFIEGFMVTFTNFLNRYSRDYRYVIRVLAKEKKLLKEKTTYNQGLRVGSSQVWQPAGSYQSILRQTMLASSSLVSHSSEDKPPLSEDSDTKALATSLPYSSEKERRRASVFTIPEIRILAASLERGLDSPVSSERSGDNGMDPYDEYGEGEMSSYEQPTIVRMLLAIWYIIMSRSELLCYFIIFLNQIKSATFLSLPLPLMVFFWGTLTIPRPSKTFWVTIIAYTEIIVLVKCMFQFEIMPWNKYPITSWFHPARIIGIERKNGYATWDLLLLLVVFFHRFMLKSMGLWKSVAPVPAAMLEEGEYILDEGGLVPVSSTPKHLSYTQDSKDELDEIDEIKELNGVDNENLYTVDTKDVDPSDDYRSIFRKACSKYSKSMRNFFKQLVDPTSRVAADVYSYMFMCDFFNFFVILIGYSSFGAQQGDGGVSAYLEDNRVPPLFLVMLILQFMLIIIDRGIFLRKNITAKIIFQFSQIILLHLWLFVLFPIMTGSQFNTVLPPQMYYMVKCFYLLLSAFQIRCGYPTRILGNFLCKGYNYLNMFLFKAFMLIPFLFELRTVMDWMWTDTSMTVFDWIKMEDIFAHIFQLKCTRHTEDEFPQPRGVRKKPVIKYLMGGGILALIIAVIWFPLVFFSLGNAVGQPNVPYDVTLEIRIGPYEPVYQMSAQSNSIDVFSDSDYQILLGTYSTEKTATFFINNYEPSDIAAIRLNTDSANIWSISPPDRQRMVSEVNSTSPLSVRLEYKVSHKTSKPEDSGLISDSVEIIIPAEVNKTPNPMRTNLLNMLLGKSNASTPAIILEHLLPKFLKVTNRGTAKPVAQLMNPDPNDKYRNISLNLLRPSNQSGTEKEWWKIQESCSDSNYEDFLKNIPYADCRQIIMYTFNDKIFPATLNILTGGGIIGLYTTLVFVASRVLRGFFAEQCFKIMFEDMPNVDRVLQLCLDVYLVREAREFMLEEDLFAKLVFLFRSPETLIKWTRPKEEMEDDEDPEGDE